MTTTATAETPYIYFFDWVAVPTAPGREDETIVECKTYRDVLDLITADDESMGYVPALRVRRLPRDYGDDLQAADRDGHLKEGFAYVMDDSLPEQTEIVWPTHGLRLEVPKRYRREVAPVAANQIND